MTDTVLASWKDGPVKRAIVDFVTSTTTQAFTVHAAGVAVYHLGNNGTARALLKEWPLTNH